MLSDDNLAWCLRQKRGIRIIEPNSNLTKAYLKKSISALNTMTAALKINETDWILTTAYYARYFALYALLMKIGIKSEIHDCTVSLATLLSQKGILAPDLAEDLAQSKDMRVDTQYYDIQQADHRVIQRNVQGARSFVLEVEKVIEEITAEQINDVRLHLTRLKETQ